MGFVQKAETVMVGTIMLLIIAVFIGALDPQLTAELGNTEAHPNGLLTLTLIALLVVGFAMAILLSIFVDQPPREDTSFQQRQFGGDFRR